MTNLTKIVVIRDLPEFSTVSVVPLSAGLEVTALFVQYPVRSPVCSNVNHGQTIQPQREAVWFSKEKQQFPGEPQKARLTCKPNDAD